MFVYVVGRLWPFALTALLLCLISRGARCSLHRHWRQVGAALRWNAPSDADAEALRAASLAAVEAEMDWGEAEEALPFPAEEMGPPQDACEA